MTIKVFRSTNTTNRSRRIAGTIVIIVLITFIIVILVNRHKPNSSNVEVHNTTEPSVAGVSREKRSDVSSAADSRDILPSFNALPNLNVLDVEWVRLTTARDNLPTGRRTLTMYCYCRLREPDATVRALMNHGVIWKMNTNSGVLLFGPQAPGVPQRAIQTHARGDFFVEEQIPDSTTILNEVSGVVRCIKGHDRQVVVWENPKNEIGSSRGSTKYNFSLLRYDVAGDIAKIHFGVKIPKGEPFEPDYWAEYLTEYRLLATDGFVFSGAEGGIESKVARYDLAGKIPKSIEVEFFDSISQDFFGFQFKNIKLPDDLSLPTTEFINKNPAGSKNCSSKGFNFSIRNSVFEATLQPNGSSSSKLIFNIDATIPKSKSVILAPTFLNGATIVNSDNITFDAVENPECIQILNDGRLSCKAVFPYTTTTPFIRTLKYVLKVFVQEMSEIVVIPLEPGTIELSKSGVTRHEVHRVGEKYMVKFSVNLAFLANKDIGSEGIQYELLDKANQKVPIKSASTEVSDEMLTGELIAGREAQFLKVQFPKSGHFEEISVEFNNIYLRTGAEEAKKKSEF